MSLNYQIFSDIKLVYLTGEGIITFNDLMHYIEELSHDPLYIKPMKKIADYRKAQDVILSSNQSLVFTERKAALRNVFAGEKCAIIAPNDTLYGTARVHDASIAIQEPGIQTSVFRDINEAIQWLQISLDESLLNQIQAGEVSI